MSGNARRAAPQAATIPEYFAVYRSFQKEAAAFSEQASAQISHRPGFTVEFDGEQITFPKMKMMRPTDWTDSHVWVEAHLNLLKMEAARAAWDKENAERLAELENLESQSNRASQAAWEAERAIAHIPSRDQEDFAIKANMLAAGMRDEGYCEELLESFIEDAVRLFGEARS